MPPWEVGSIGLFLVPFCLGRCDSSPVGLALSFKG